MIRRRTVLVLGAGASAPYGLPTGKRLREMILDVPSEHERQIEITLTALDYTTTELQEFQGKLLRAGRTTIDAFLREQDDRTQRLGKLLIAFFLLSHENDVNLYKNVVPADDWFEYLVNEIMDVRFDRIQDNRLSTVTLNYDRSFEQRLFDLLRHGTNRSPEDCAAKARTIPVIHLHGQLGGLPELGGSPGVPYSTAPAMVVQSEDALELEFHRALGAAVSQFKLAHEMRLDDKTIVEAGRLLRGAGIVVFLGFGFDPDNLARLVDRLRPTETDATTGEISNAKSFYATSHHLPPQREAEARAVLSQFGTIHFTDTKCRGLLENLGGVLTGQPEAT